MKRCCAFLLLILLSAAKDLALAERPVFDIPSVVVGFYGREVKISYFRNRESPTGELAVLDEQGNQLTAMTVPYNRKKESLYFTAEGSFPTGQMLRIVFRVDGQETIQQECFLALDDADREGIRKIDTQEKKIAITFDAANSPAQTAKLLELLDQYHVHSTFFLQGDFAAGHPETAAAIVQAGHETGNHSMYHVDMRTATDATVYAQISKANEALTAATGQPVTLYRPPAGYTTYRDRTIAHALGLETVLWTFDSMDGFVDQYEIQILNRMLEKSEPGAIVLMHVYGQYTLAVLEQYLPQMQEQGYEFVTVSELMACAEH
ncbi:MAG: polysaccharide deacetylase family protein [Clostridia bacterium]|nr:polysaccharide deacetylase family protein [Clostridia bacterium]